MAVGQADSGRKNDANRGKHLVLMYSKTKPMMGAPKPEWLKRPSAPIVMAAQLHDPRHPDKTTCTAIMMTTVDVGIPATRSGRAARRGAGAVAPRGGGSRGDSAGGQGQEAFDHDTESS